MGTTDTLTAQYFCDLIGISTVETESIKKEAGIEGEFEYGQKNISTLKRNVLNIDEILRMPATKLIVNLRGNNPIILDKIIYKEHILAEQLKDSSISEYKPKWTRNISKETLKENIKKTDESEIEKTKLNWDNF